MKGWTLRLPRRRCPVCGAEIECAFNGRFTVKGRYAGKDVLSAKGKKRLKKDIKNCGESIERGLRGDAHDE